VSGACVEGSLTKIALLDWMEKLLVSCSMLLTAYCQSDPQSQMPKCSVYPGPLSVLVLDNARIHHNDEILALADRFGVRIEYLPPYSPNFNLIEEAFSKIKLFIRRHGDYYAATMGDGIMFDMYEVLDIITSEDAEGYFMHAGYF
jgi:transposase